MDTSRRYAIARDRFSVLLRTIEWAHSRDRTTGRTESVCSGEVERAS